MRNSGCVKSCTGVQLSGTFPLSAKEKKKGSQLHAPVSYYGSPAVAGRRSEQFVCRSVNVICALLGSTFDPDLVALGGAGCQCNKLYPHTSVTGVPLLTYYDPLTYPIPSILIPAFHYWSGGALLYSPLPRPSCYAADIVRSILSCSLILWLPLKPQR